MIWLDFDPYFVDYNFCETWDPALRKGPTESDLYKLIFRARNGSRSAIGEFAETMWWTLRPATYESFLRAHGERPITHSDWFYAKVMQFIGILICDEIRICELTGCRELKPTESIPKDAFLTGSTSYLQPDDIEALQPEQWNTYAWHQLVETVLANPTDRLESTRRWLKAQPADQASESTRFGKGWSKNEERDQVIANLLARGESAESICEKLDNLSIPVLPSIAALGIHRWKDGWKNTRTRNAIRQLLSKLPKRRNLVNTLRATE